MNYRVLILPRAHKSLAKLPRPTVERIRAVIRGLATDPRPPGCKKLTD
jgi:mRNA interferase RelE/StbE